MKQQINIVLFILISCLLSACSHDDFGINDTGMAGDERMPVLIAGNQSVSTRVTDLGANFSQNDPIGVFMKKSGELLNPQSISEGVDNIEFRCNRVLQISYFQQVGETVYYPVDDNERVDFIAYYPYNSSINNYIYPIDVTMQPLQTTTTNELDILYSNNVTKRTKSKDTIPLTFNHIMSRIQLELWKENGQDYIDATLVRITGLKCTAGLNLVTGLVEQLDSEGDIQLSKAYQYIYRAFFIPQPAPNSKLYITTQNDGVLIYEFPPDMVFEPGKYYQYTITIKNKTELEVNQVSITDWNGKDVNPIEDIVD